MPLLWASLPKLKKLAATLGKECEPKAAGLAPEGQQPFAHIIFLFCVLGRFLSPAFGATIALLPPVAMLLPAESVPEGTFLEQ